MQGSHLLLLKELKSTFKDIPILGLSTDWHQILANHFISAGGTGIIERTSLLEKFIDAVKSVIANKIYIDQKIKLRLSPFSQLTDRESKVMNTLFITNSQKEASHKLQLCLRTYENHLKSIYKKTNVNNQKELTILAAKYNLI